MGLCNDLNILGFKNLDFDHDFSDFVMQNLTLSQTAQTSAPNTPKTVDFQDRLKNVNFRKMKNTMLPLGRLELAQTLLENESQHKIIQKDDMQLPKFLTREADRIPLIQINV